MYVFHITIFFFISNHKHNQSYLLQCRPAQLAELSRSEFDPELFSHIAYIKFLCDIRDKIAVFNVLRQNMTIFYVGNGYRGGK